MTVCAGRSGCEIGSGGARLAAAWEKSGRRHWGLGIGHWWKGRRRWGPVTRRTFGVDLARNGVITGSKGVIWGCVLARARRVVATCGANVASASANVTTVSAKVATSRVGVTTCGANVTTAKAVVTALRVQLRHASRTPSPSHPRTQAFPSAPPRSPPLLDGRLASADFRCARSYACLPALAVHQKVGRRFGDVDSFAYVRPTA